MSYPASAAKLALFLTLATAMATMSSAQNAPSDYVRLHNAARAAVGVGAVSWDNTVAAYAQSYADKRKGDCALRHSGGRYGENIFWGSAGADWTAASAVGSWTDEKKNYHHDGNRCDSGKVCGHYTQVVWRKSTAIGCARVVCDAGRGVFVVCSYNPPGNFNGESPY